MRKPMATGFAALLFAGSLVKLVADPTRAVLTPLDAADYRLQSRRRARNRSATASATRSRFGSLDVHGALLAWSWRQQLDDNAVVDAQPGGDGEILSGGFSPTIGKSIAFARIPAGTEGGPLQADIRGKLVPVRVVTYPFVRDGQPTAAV